MVGLVGVTVVFLATMALLLVSSELGFFVGRRERERSSQDGRSQVGIIEGALLGLLALLLGFTFSMAVERYNQRQQLVVREANAIGTVFLRSDILTAESRALAVARLREYADARLEFFHAGADEERLKESVRKAGRLQNDLWALVREESKVRPGVAPAILMMAMNDLFDLGEERIFALENTVPYSVWVVLYLVAALSAGSLGYGSGLAGRRLMLQIILVPLLMGIILTLLLDLDHPRHGLIRTSQSSIVRVRDSLK
jgi:hypothetical protein